MTDNFVRIDATPYTSVPKINALNGVGLACAIIAALPKGAPGGVRHAAKHMRADAVAVQDVCFPQTPDGKAGEAPPRSIFEVDTEEDSLHVANYRRLNDYTLLAGHDAETVARAASLKAELYGTGGTGFIHGDNFAQWTATENWFRTLAKGDNDATLRRLVGGGFVDAIRTVHTEYGEAGGFTKPLPPEAPKVDVATPLAALADSMKDLALQLVALANDRSVDSALREGARAALRPIDDLRASNARRLARTKKAAPVATPATPAPAEGGRVVIPQVP